MDMTAVVGTATPAMVTVDTTLAAMADMQVMVLTAVTPAMGRDTTPVTTTKQDISRVLTRSRLFGN